MRLFWRILLVLIVVGVIYALLRGLGITNSLKRHKAEKKMAVLDDFEYPNEDFDWATGGYVKLENSKDNQTHGKHSCKATFFLAAQFYSTPTPEVSAPLSVVSAPVSTKTGSRLQAVAPSPVPALSTPTPTAVWQPAMTLSHESVTKLNKYDWSEFNVLKLDVFNPQDKPVSYHLKIADGRAFIHDVPGVLTPKKVTNISVLLDDLSKERMDLTSIQSLAFSVDVADATKPVELYLDYLRLEEEPPTAAPKK